MTSAPTHRLALVAYALAFAALAFPYWLLGEVIAPHRNDVELGAPTASMSMRAENRKFGDYASAFIPEIDAHVRAPRSGWLATWTDANALGRPLSHLAGFSPAYPPSLVLAAVTDRPERFLTALSLATCFLAGLFVLLACREMGLAPWPSLLAAGTVGASPLLMYWLTFPMFPAVWCWSAGALWAIARMARGSDLLAWTALAFSAYSLLMTAHPQPVVYHAYILAGYAVCAAWNVRRRSGDAAGVRMALAVVSAAAAGAAMAAPVYADLAHAAAESARASPDPTFFLAALPNVDSFAAALQLVVLGTFPEVLGNPISPAYPLPYDGLSVTALALFLGLAGLALRPREVWGWWLAIAVLLAFALVPSLYLVGVRYLGFNLSRSTPLGSILLPLAIAGAHGAQALLQRDGKRRALTAWICAGAVLGLLLLAVAFAQAGNLEIRWSVVAIAAAICACLAAQALRPQPMLLGIALVATLAYGAYPLMLRQPLAAVTVTSPLVEQIGDALPPGTRYAVAAPGIGGVLPPNSNAPLGLASVHSHNSLSSRRYQDLIRALGGQTHTYGRWNDSIAPDYGADLFAMSGVGLVLAPAALRDPNLAHVATVGAVHLHRVESTPGCCVLVDPAALGTGASGLPRAGDPGLRPVAKTRDLGDYAEIEVVGERDSVLVLSQAFHRDWRAETLLPTGWTAASTLAVGGFFLGVHVPRDARQVRLRFEPWVRHAWIAHGFWGALLIVLAFRTRRKTTRTNR